jgi:hypothetical protein
MKLQKSLKVLTLVLIASGITATSFAQESPTEGTAGCIYRDVGPYAPYRYDNTFSAAVCNTLTEGKVVTMSPAEAQKLVDANNAKLQEQANAESAARETAAAPAPVTTKSDCDNAYTSCMSKPGHTSCQKAHSLCLSTATTPAAVPAAAPAPAPAPVVATPTGQSSCDDVYNTCMSKPGHTGCQKARTNCLDVGTTNKR